MERDHVQQAKVLSKEVQKVNECLDSIITKISEGAVKEKACQQVFLILLLHICCEGEGWRV